MHIDAHDFRPGTALDGARPDPAQLAGGALTALLVPAAIAVAAALATAVSAVLGTLPRDDGAAIEEHVVEARFVRLGKPLDPHKLPNRKVPLKATAPDEKVVVSDSPEEHERPDAGVKPPNAEPDDVLRDVLGSANKFAEIAEQRELEGSPDGLAEGTADKATPGSMLGIFFRKGWDVPNTISPGELSKLVATAQVQLTDDLKVADYELVDESGNPVFDQSVLDQLHRLQQSGATVPDSPDDPADRYRGRTVKANFRGKDAR